MSFRNPPSTIREMIQLVQSERRSKITLKANGGNSILLVCDPATEAEYISYLEDFLPKEDFSIIDLNECLTDFVSKHGAEVAELYEMLQSATHEIFKAPAGEEAPDLFKEIITRIHAAFQTSKVPVLINTGVLYGTGIQNVHIMENESVMKATLPIIILYPATHEADRLLFLGKQPASKYRCMIIE